GMANLSYALFIGGEISFQNAARSGSAVRFRGVGVGALCSVDWGPFDAIPFTSV
ncbi:hypothetical protein GA0115257_11031, partial [Streptomyces sp. LcepLS]